ncbi:MAG: hypothetical protein D6797_04390, partial [Bdellovibrio sp.]
SINRIYGDCLTSACSDNQYISSAEEMAVFVPENTTIKVKYKVDDDFVLFDGAYSVTCTDDNGLIINSGNWLLKDGCHLGGGCVPNYKLATINVDAGWHYWHLSFCERGGNDWFDFRVVDESGNNFVPYYYYFTAVNHYRYLSKIHLNEGLYLFDCKDFIDNDGDWNLNAGAYENDGIPAPWFNHTLYNSTNGYEVLNDNYPQFGELNVDCFDEGCDGKPGPYDFNGNLGNCNYQNEHDCNDDYDNDFDGLTDSFDPDCRPPNADCSLLNKSWVVPSSKNGLDGCCGDDNYTFSPDGTGDYGWAGPDPDKDYLCWFNETSGKGQWVWAKEPTVPFHLYNVENNTKKVSDTVSNGQQWYYCDATGDSVLTSGSEGAIAVGDEESFQGATISTHDPLYCYNYPDLDGDGCCDEFEDNKGTDPCDIQDYPMVDGEIDPDCFNPNPIFSKCTLTCRYACTPGIDTDGDSIDDPFDAVNDGTRALQFGCDGTDNPHYPGPGNCPNLEDNGERSSYCGGSSGGIGERPKDDLDTSIIQEHPCEPENTSEACTNIDPDTLEPIDDDYDGFANCEDADCWAFPVCDDYADWGGTERDCGDNNDNDGDGSTDCEDTNCTQNGYDGDGYKCNYVGGLDSNQYDTTYKNRSFLCYKANSTNYFAECCSYNDCKNINTIENYNFFGIGDNIHVLESFDTTPNNVRVIDNVFIINLVPSPIKWSFSNWVNWSGFNTLELDYGSNQENIKMRLYDSDENPIRDVKFWNNSVSGGSTGVFHHVSYDLTANPINQVVAKFSVEAVGSDSGKIILDNIYLTTDSNPDNSDNWYCGDYGIWVKDFDPASGDTDMVVAAKRGACDARLAFGWTGGFTEGHCCGDDTKSPSQAEYFNDTEAGCWGGITVPKNHLVGKMIGNRSFNNFLYVGVPNTSFFACGPISAEWKNKKVSYDGSTDESYNLVAGNLSFCSVVGDFFCNNFTNNAVQDDFYWSGDRTGLSNTIQPNERNTVKAKPYIKSGYNPRPQDPVLGCCPADACWNGTECMESWYWENYTQRVPVFNGSTDHNPVPNETWGERCINGSWEESNIKKTWDARYTGFCHYDTQCLVNPIDPPDPHHSFPADSSKPELNYSADPNNYWFAGFDYQGKSDWKNDYSATKIQCINNGTFIADHYCEEGNWSSRTKLLASFFVNMTIPTDDYTLFCEDSPKVLSGKLPVEKFPGINLSKFAAGIGYLPVDSLATNGFCVIRLNDQTIAGTSLNLEINQSMSLIQKQGYPDEAAMSFAELVSGAQNYCDNVISNPTYFDFEFHKCSNSGSMKLYYNPSLKMVVFSNQNINSLESTSFQNILQSIINFFKSIFGYVETQTGPEFSFVKEKTDFNKLFIYKKADLSKMILGVTETKYDNLTGLPQKFTLINYTGIPNIRDTLIVSSYLFRNQYSQNAFNVTNVGSSTLVYGKNVSDEVWIDLTANLEP